MKRNLILTITLFAPLFIFGQKTDTLYYDKNWKECEKDLAFYYGLKDLDKNYCGIENYYYLTGQKHSLKHIYNGSQHGKAVWWYKNEAKWCEGYYKNGLKDSLWTFWYPTGQMESQGFYKDTIKIDWKYWDEKGNQLYNYKDVDIPPLFGNEKKPNKSVKSLLKYLAENTEYPDVGMEKKLEGLVLVYFVIDESGNVVDVKVIEGINHYLDDEAKRIIENLPKWKPAMHNSKNVRVNFRIPIRFRLN